MLLVLGFPGLLRIPVFRTALQFTENSISISGYRKKHRNIELKTRIKIPGSGRFAKSVDASVYSWRDVCLFATLSFSRQVGAKRLSCTMELSSWMFMKSPITKVMQSSELGLISAEYLRTQNTVCLQDHRRRAAPTSLVLSNPTPWPTSWTMLTIKQGLQFYAESVDLNGSIDVTRWKLNVLDYNMHMNTIFHHCKWFAGNRFCPKHVKLKGPGALEHQCRSIFFYNREPDSNAIKTHLAQASFIVLEMLQSFQLSTWIVSGKWGFMASKDKTDFYIFLVTMVKFERWCSVAACWHTQTRHFMSPSGTLELQLEEMKVFARIQWNQLSF